MNAARHAGKSVGQAVVRRSTGIDNGSRSHERGLTTLGWIGLVGDGAAPQHDELAIQSLTAEHSCEEPAHWIA